MEEHQTNGNFEKIHGDNLRKNPFTVPEGYFDTLPVEIMKKVEKKPSDPGIFQLREFFIHSGRAVAASVVFLIGISLFYWFNKPEVPTQYTGLPEITAEEIIASEVLQESILYDEAIEEAIIEYAETEDSLSTVLITELKGDTDLELILDYLSEEDLNNEELAMLYTDN